VLTVFSATQGAADPASSNRGWSGIEHGDIRFDEDYARFYEAYSGQRKLPPPVEGRTLYSELGLLQQKQQLLAQHQSMMSSATPPPNQALLMAGGLTPGGKAAAAAVVAAELTMLCYGGSQHVANVTMSNLETHTARCVLSCQSNALTTVCWLVLLLRRP
jgi:hypothetical protein